MAKQKNAAGVGEWSDHSLNCVAGCSHTCGYCFARGIAARFKRIAPEKWKDEKIVPYKKIGKRKGTIMFPSSHDITPVTLDHCIEFLDMLLSAGNNVLLVSKPHLECVK